MSESALAIDFGAITGGAAPAQGAADKTLADASGDLLQQLQLGAPSELSGLDDARSTLPGQAAGEFSCLKMLTPEQQEQARAAAKQLFPQMLNNTELLADFGNKSIEVVNAQVSRIFREIGPVQIPELTNIMKQVNDAMRSFRKSYDPNIPKMRDFFEKVSTGVRGFFQRGRDIVEMLFEEARGVERQLDLIAGRLIDKQQELRRNVVLCDELYAANEKSISQLIGTIAIMECVREEAVAAMESIKIDATDPERRNKEELRNRIADFISAMMTRISEFQQRLFIAWATSPQVRNTRSLHYGLAQRLALMVNLTIPTMKLTIAQWGLMMQGQQAAEMQQVVADGANEVLSAYAQASGQATGQIARAIQTPTLRPETIREVADSLEQQAAGMIEAVNYGQHARQEVVDALLAAQTSISKGATELASTVLRLADTTDKHVDLLVMAGLPETITMNAPRFQQPIVGR